MQDDEPETEQRQRALDALGARRAQIEAMPRLPIPYCEPRPVKRDTNPENWRWAYGATGRVNALVEREKQVLDRMMAERQERLDCLTRRK